MASSGAVVEEFRDGYFVCSTGIGNKFRIAALSLRGADQGFLGQREALWLCHCVPETCSVQILGISVEHICMQNCLWIACPQRSLKLSLTSPEDLIARLASARTAIRKKDAWVGRDGASSK